MTLKSKAIWIIVMVIQLACFYTTTIIMDMTIWGLWSWQTLCVGASLIVMGLVNYAHGLCKCDVAT